MVPKFGLLKKTIGRLGEPVIRKSMNYAMKLLIFTPPVFIHDIPHKTPEFTQLIFPRP